LYQSKTPKVEMLCRSTNFGGSAQSE